jgi:hypothetical protein
MTPSRTQSSTEDKDAHEALRGPHDNGINRLEYRTYEIFEITFAEQVEP